jgi:hypothetical protein
MVVQINDTSLDHMTYLTHVNRSDRLVLKHKEATYGGSWKKRGGVGAFMMMARKWDRLENIVAHLHHYDVFDAILTHPHGNDGTVLAEVRDLRRYLLLVEAEMVARGVVSPEEAPFPDGATMFGTPEDGGHHERANQEAEDIRLGLKPASWEDNQP